MALSIGCHVEIHVDFSSKKISLLHILAWSDGVGLFDQWEILKCNGHGPLLSYVKWPQERDSNATKIKLIIKSRKWKNHGVKRTWRWDGGIWYQHDNPFGRKLTLDCLTTRKRGPRAHFPCDKGGHCDVPYLHVFNQIYNCHIRSTTHVNGVMLQWPPLSHGKCVLSPTILVH